MSGQVSSTGLSDQAIIFTSCKVFTEEPNSINPREAFFASFSRRCKSMLEERKQHVKPLMMVTGGFRSRSGMNGALQDGSTDLIGIARPSCIEPTSLPHKLLDPAIADAEAVCLPYRLKGIKLFQYLSPIKVVGAGLTTSEP